jgi:hypothetical protein
MGNGLWLHDVCRRGGYRHVHYFFTKRQMEYICRVILGPIGLVTYTSYLSMWSLWDKFQTLKLQSLWDGGSTSQPIGG